MRMDAGCNTHHKVVVVVADVVGGRAHHRHQLHLLSLPLSHTFVDVVAAVVVELPMPKQRFDT